MREKGKLWFVQVAGHCAQCDVSNGNGGDHQTLGDGVSDRMFEEERFVGVVFVWFSGVGCIVLDYLQSLRIVVRNVVVSYVR